MEEILASLSIGRRHGRHRAEGEQAAEGVKKLAVSLTSMPLVPLPLDTRVSVDWKRREACSTRDLHAGDLQFLSNFSYCQWRASS